MRHSLRLIPLLAVLLAVSCRVSPGNDSARIRVAALRGPSAVEMVRLMDSLRCCPDPGMEVLIFDEPLLLRKEMMEGSVDFAVLPLNMAALLYNRGVDYRLAAVPIWGSLYLCGSDTSVRSISDLRGRTVSLMQRGMTPDVLMRHLLESEGIDPDRDLTLDYRFPSHIDLANAAIASRTELCVLSEPYLSQVVAANPSLEVLVDLGAEWRRAEKMPLAETAFLCRGTLADSSDPAVDSLVTALRRSADWAKVHPDSAAALSVGFGINPDRRAVEASIPRSGFEVVRAADAETEIMYYLRVLLQASPDALGNRLPDERFIVR